MIVQYAVKITKDLENHIFHSLLEIISEERKKKIENYRNPMDQQRSLFAEIVLRYALYQQYSLKGDEIMFTYDSYGKPALEKYPNIYFNLSHAGDWVLCGIGDVSLGVDIEQITEIDLKIAKRFFHEKEYAYLLSINEPNRRIDFFHLWTLKESYIKEVGKGLSIALDSFYFATANDEIILYNQHGVKQDNCFLIGELEPGYCNAICIHCNQDEAINQDIIKVSVKELVNWKKQIF